jgi:hypothetical protein
MRSAFHEETQHKSQELLPTPAFASEERARFPLLSFLSGFGNDPSAGSPTETLLRLLLPLNDQVWPISVSQRERKPPLETSKVLT